MGQCVGGNRDVWLGCGFFCCGKKMMKLIASLATAGLTLTHGLTENEATSILRADVESYSTKQSGSLCSDYKVSQSLSQSIIHDYCSAAM
jgi:hypothetical protein